MGLGIGLSIKLLLYIEHNRNRCIEFIKFELSYTFTVYNFTANRSQTSVIIVIMLQNPQVMSHVVLLKKSKGQYNT